MTMCIRKIVTTIVVTLVGENMEVANAKSENDIQESR